ncbi:hypothetical protein K435DRAFT_774665 [Dendrothele bispora CBS 962.96]|uniref:Uncharacterized protein n=1 Tax=Dendrothele bispora (strain CBS 962.96) TaxID=1314807 RepID=A0A4S8MNB1_DENBC|nr:hypothetical protein K435DRAFT_774665 [Dendrothele bispora CBS 962.96]
MLRKWIDLTQRSLVASNKILRVGLNTVRNHSSRTGGKPAFLVTTEYEQQDKQDKQIDQPE